MVAPPSIQQRILNLPPEGCGGIPFPRGLLSPTGVRTRGVVCVPTPSGMAPLGPRGLLLALTLSLGAAAHAHAPGHAAPARENGPPTPVWGGLNLSKGEGQQELLFCCENINCE